MQVAMKDLEIRGAGNLLGGEQSGHIAGVGFDLYVRLVGEAVAEFRGERRGGAARGQGRAAGRRAPAARLHRARAAAAGGVPQDRGGAGRRRRSTRSAPSSSTATARCPTPVENLFEVARVPLHVRARRAHRRHRAGQVRAVRARSSCPSRRSCGSSGSTRARVLKPAVRTVLVPVPDDGADRRHARCGAARCSPGRGSSSTRWSRGRLRGRERRHRAGSRDSLVGALR